MHQPRAARGQHCPQGPPGSPGMPPAFPSAAEGLLLSPGQLLRAAPSQGFTPLMGWAQGTGRDSTNVTLPSPGPRGGYLLNSICTSATQGLG